MPVRDYLDWIEVGRHALKVGGAITWTGVLHYKKGKWAEHPIYLPLPDCNAMWPAGLPVIMLCPDGMNNLLDYTPQ